MWWEPLGRRSAEDRRLGLRDVGVRREAVALASGLALWLGLFPIVQATHLAFADHDHCFCSEHHRIEDVPRAASSGARVLQRAERSPRLGPAPTSLPRPTPPDHLLNFTLSREPLLSPDHATGPVSNDRAATDAPRLLDGVIARPLLRLAPKTSPPSAAAA